MSDLVFPSPSPKSYPRPPSQPYEVLDTGGHVLNRFSTFDLALAWLKRIPEARDLWLSEHALRYVAERTGLPVARSSVMGRVCVHGGRPLTWDDTCSLCESVTPSRPMPPHPLRPDGSTETR